MAAMRVIFGVSFLLLPAGIIYVIINPKARKTHLSNLVLALGLLLFFQVVGPRLANIIRQNIWVRWAKRAPSRRFQWPVPASRLFHQSAPMAGIGQQHHFAAIVIGIPLAVFAYVRWRRAKQFGALGPLEELATQLSRRSTRCRPARPPAQHHTAMLCAHGPGAPRSARAGARQGYDSA